MTGLERPLRVLMAVQAAGAVGGLEASFARIEPELSAAGVAASAIVVGPPETAAAASTFLQGHLPTCVVSGWREIWRAVAAYDVVHVHGATSSIWPAWVIVASRLRRVPLVVTLHLPSHPLPQRRLRGKLRSRALMAGRGLLLLLSGAAVYAPSGAAARVARRQLRPWPLPVESLWNGVVDPGSAQVSTTGPLRLVFVGRLAEHKQPLEFVSAVEMACAAGAELTADIVGDGPLRQEVERAVAASAYGERFTIHGQCDDPTKLMRNGDLLVLTSMTEGCPLVAMEAAGTGRGVLARASIEGLAEGWRDAFVAVPDDAGASGFAEQMTRLAFDRRAVARLGAAARCRYEERFSAARAADALRAAYEGARR